MWLFGSPLASPGPNIRIDSASRIHAMTARVASHLTKNLDALSDGESKVSALETGITSVIPSPSFAGML
jgi:hypothetical protein